MVAPPVQPMFCPPGSGVQSANGTSHTLRVTPPSTRVPTSRLHDEFVQSASVRQNWKQRGKLLHTCSVTQTRPGAQLSVCAGAPTDDGEQSCPTVRGNCDASGWLQVSVPTVLTEHFSRHPQPIWQYGSH